MTSIKITKKKELDDVTVSSSQLLTACQGLLKISSKSRISSCSLERSRRGPLNYVSLIESHTGILSYKVFLPLFCISRRSFVDSRWFIPKTVWKWKGLQKQVLILTSYQYSFMVLFAVATSFSRMLRMLRSAQFGASWYLSSPLWNAPLILGSKCEVLQQFVRKTDSFFRCSLRCCLDYLIIERLEVSKN